MSDYRSTGEAFQAMAHSIVWCTVATGHFRSAPGAGRVRPGDHPAVGRWTALAVVWRAAPGAVPLTGVPGDAAARGSRRATAVAELR